MAVNTVNFMDRQVLNILAEPIKQDLRLADWQLGAMNGLAFAFLYTVMGLPIARLAERRNRPMIIAACITVWSAFTMVCGVATSFTQLVLARVGVGIGEAGCTPAASALISEMVPRHRRASAMAFFAIAAPLGGVVGLGLGGVIADSFGWRTTFIAIGALGVPLGLLTLLVIREPRSGMTSAQAIAAGAPSFLETIAILRRKKTFLLVTAGTAGKYFVGYGHAAFIASFMLRNHTAQIAQVAASVHLKPVGLVGLALGLTTGPAYMISAMVGGWIADKFGRTDPRAYVMVPSLAMLIQVPLYVAVFLVRDVRIALVLLNASALCASTYYGTTYAAIQGVVKPQMRATAAAVFGLSTTLVGLGLGPLAVGAMSDTLAKAAALGPGPGLKWALIISLLVEPVVFIFYWRARTTITAEMED